MCQPHRRGVSHYLGGRPAETHAASLPRAATFQCSSMRRCTGRSKPSWKLVTRNSRTRLSGLSVSNHRQESHRHLQKHGWSQMASQNPPRSSDDMVLFALEQGLREVWAVLKAHDPMGI
jgi:hypothetical protein